MKNVTLKFKLAIIFAFLIFKFNALGQKVSLEDNGYIISFSTIYSSNLIDLNTNNDIYLIRSKKSFKWDSLFCILSTRPYTSFSDILDTLSHRFDIYKIANNDIRYYKNKNFERIFRLIQNRNSYRTGYLYNLSEEIKKNNSAVIGYVMNRYSIKKTIFYKDIGLIRPFSDYKSVIIYRIFDH